jgi:hypothetical protein
MGNVSDGATGIHNRVIVMVEEFVRIATALLSYFRRVEMAAGQI